MFNVEKLVRKNILELKPYSSARDEYKGNTGIFLDANENPFGNLNRYPDPYQKALKEKLAELKSIPAEHIFIGNGSDEIIDAVYRIFCNPGKDKALTFSPTYGMYDVSANINDVELIKVPLNENFQINFKLLEQYIDDEQLKLIFICSPNNPTGNCINDIEKILNRFNGMVFVDEAYIDFSKEPSLIRLLKRYPNLIVSQTFSKAWGMAAARVGMAFANEAIIGLLNKVKPPYNVSTLNQEAALNNLNNTALFESNKKEILEQRELLQQQLSALAVIKKIYPSDANFLLVETTDANTIYANLVAQKIITRNRNTILHNCIRITVGTSNENNELINALKKLS